MRSAENIHSPHPVGTHVPAAWRLWENPILRACGRERLRLRSALIWGGVTFLLTALFSAEVFLTLTQRGLSSAEVAARDTFRVVFVLQALILMLLGTGSVAAGLARERELGLLDYHRMTPMSPTAKILGFLLGLASREYLMVATTLPFTVASVVIARLDPWRVLQLYLVFLTSVWLYHMTGLVAGMVARRPRRANWFTRLIILALYIFLPQLGAIGFTFLGYLTVMPAFDGLLASELGWQATETARLWQQVGFFTVHVPPTLYTLFVQGLLLVSLYVLVRRKWQQQSLHAYAKPTALLLYAGLQVLVLGSLWPFLAEHTPRFLALRHGRGPGGSPGPAAAFPVEAQWLLTLYVFFFVVGIAGMLLVAVITPTWEGYLQGLRRARRLGRVDRRGAPRIPWTSDGSPGLATTLALAAITALCYLLLFGLALPREGLTWNPSVGAHLTLLLLAAGLLLQVQTVCAFWGSKGLLVLIGAVWLLPAAVGVLLASAFGEYVAAGYLGAFTPVAAFLYGLLRLFEPAVAREPELVRLMPHLPGMLALAMVAFLGLPLGGQAWLWRSRREARAQVEAQARADAAAASELADGAGQASAPPSAP